MPWRVVGSDKLAELPLHVRIAMTEDEAVSWMGRIPGGNIVQVTIDEIEHQDAWRSSATGHLPIERVQGSAALHAAFEERRKPVAIVDETLGELWLDRVLNHFESDDFTFRGQECTLAIHQSGGVEDRARDQRDIAHARAALARIDASWPSLEQTIVDDSLRRYNEDWRDEQPAITAEELLAQIQLSSIDITQDRVTLYFNDGGLFCDHLIEVRLSPTTAELLEEIGLAG